MLIVVPYPGPRYIAFWNAAEQRLTLKWLSPQEKAIFLCSQKVYVYSENFLKACLRSLKEEEGEIAGTVTAFGGLSI